MAFAKQQLEHALTSNSELRSRVTSLEADLLRATAALSPATHGKATAKNGLGETGSSASSIGLSDFSTSASDQTSTRTSHSDSGLVDENPSAIEDKCVHLCV